MASTEERDAVPPPMHCTAFVTGDPDGCARCGEAEDLHDTATTSRSSSTAGRHTCGSCLQWVGTSYGVETRPYTVWPGDDGRDHISCADKDACERRWQATEASERFAAAEARAWFPEDEDEDDG